MISQRVRREFAELIDSRIVHNSERVWTSGDIVALRCKYLILTQIEGRSRSTKEIPSYDGLNFMELQYRNVVEHMGEQIELYRGERGAREREREGRRDGGTE